MNYSSIYSFFLICIIATEIHNVYKKQSQQKPTHMIGHKNLLQDQLQKQQLT